MARPRLTSCARAHCQHRSRLGTQPIGASLRSRVRVRSSTLEPAYETSLHPSGHLAASRVWRNWCLTLGGGGALGDQIERATATRLQHQFRWRRPRLCSPPPPVHSDLRLGAMGDEVDIRCTHSFPVGIKGGPCPIVHAIGWNPKPEACPEANSISMIGSISSNGVRIYNLQKRHKKWTSMDIVHCPTSEGTSLEWHAGGQVLAAATNGWGNIPGTLSILEYDGKNGFRTRTALQVLECFGESDGKADWRIINVIKVPTGICGHVYDSGDSGLFTIEREKWSYWLIYGANLTFVASSPDNEHERRKGKIKRGGSDSSGYRSIAVSRSGKFFATGGHDSLCYHEKKRDEHGHIFEMATLGCRAHNINFGYVNCIQFNPLEINTRLLALGGDTGYISIWAVGKKEKLKKVTHADRVEEYNKDYYNRTFSDADRQVDEVVEEFGRPCIKIKPQEIHVVMVVTDSSSTEAAEDTYGSADAVESVTAPEGPVDDVQSVAAVDVSAKASTSSDPVNIQGKTAEDRSNVTLADQLASVKVEINEMHHSHTHEAFGRLSHIADEAVHNVMSLGARADNMLSRIDELTQGEVKDFLEKASAAQRGRL